LIARGQLPSRNRRRHCEALLRGPQVHKPGVVAAAVGAAALTVPRCTISVGGSGDNELRWSCRLGLLPPWGDCQPRRRRRRRRRRLFRAHFLAQFGRLGSHQRLQQQNNVHVDRRTNRLCGRPRQQQQHHQQRRESACMHLSNVERPFAGKRLVKLHAERAADSSKTVTQDMAAARQRPVDGPHRGTVDPPRKKITTGGHSNTTDGKDVVPREHDPRHPHSLSCLKRQSPSPTPPHTQHACTRTCTRPHIHSNRPLTPRYDLVGTAHNCFALC
jgi:hypothetical protein